MGKLREWTEALTGCMEATCTQVGLMASAKGHRFQLLPIQRNEYLSLDVMAFPQGKARWLFPSVIMELENSPREDQIAYSLWKVLCVRAGLRIVLCYRKKSEDVAPLIQHLRQNVIEAMELQHRIGIEGTTLVVVGSRNEADTFPFGFFSWWQLDTNTGRFLKLD